MANSTNKLSILLDASVFGTTGSAKQVVSGAGAALGGGASSGTGGGSSSSGVTDQLSQLAQQLQQLQTVSQTETETVLANTEAVTQNTTQLGSSGAASTVSQAGSAVQSTLGLGLGLSPLITGLLSLFGGGGSSSQAAPTPFALPPSVGVNAGLSEGAPTQAFGLEYTGSGQPRPAVSSSSGAAGNTPNNNALSNTTNNTNQPVNSVTNNAASAPAATTQITVQVQAMDSQSFLDHSNDIALAVRQAMLQSSVLNDVIREV